MPPQYLLLIHHHGKPCEVIFFDAALESPEVKFSGGRWAAKRFLRELRTGIGWESVPVFCQKKGRGKHAGRLVECL